MNLNQKIIKPKLGLLVNSESKNKLVFCIKNLLKKTGLMPKAIKECEIEEKNVNWSLRLSGGEKQKIGIVRAILRWPNLSRLKIRNYEI